MASVLKDPSVVEHVAKQSEKAAAAARKAVLKQLSDFHKSHLWAPEDKVQQKAVATFHKAFQAHAKGKD